MTLVSLENALNLQSVHMRCSPLMGHTLANKIAHQSSKILTTGFGQSSFMSDRDYRAKLHRLDLAVGNAADLKALEHKFQSFVKDNAIRLHPLLEAQWWLRMHIVRRAGFFAPIQHLLFQSFLSALTCSERKQERLFDDRTA